MRWLALFVLVLAPAPARAQEEDAEKLYRAMEKKVLAVKSLALEFNFEMTLDDKALGTSKYTVKGSIYVAAGNRIRLEAEGDLFGGKKALSVTNGESIYEKVGDKILDKNLGEARKSKALVGTIARFGAAAALMEKKLGAFDPDKDHPVKNFKLGVKQMVGKREAQVVQYQVEEKSGKLSTEVVSVWIDTKTQLPLKRAMVNEVPGKQVFRSTEIYSVFTIDPKLEGKLFEIPTK
jgi:hypothetical protein